jgi:hypothetical protein
LLYFYNFWLILNLWLYFLSLTLLFYLLCIWNLNRWNLFLTGIFIKSGLSTHIKKSKVLREAHNWFSLIFRLTLRTLYEKLSIILTRLLLCKASWYAFFANCMSACYQYSRNVVLWLITYIALWALHFYLFWWI